MAAERRDAAGADSGPFAKRSLGQNFLQDKNVARRIVDALGTTAADAVLEIGPGRGALTEHLEARSPARLTLLEKDVALAEALRLRWPHMEVVCADALAFPWERLEDYGPPSPEGRLLLIGNLPYNIASPLMWEIVSRSTAYERAVFMVQLEVARRIVASPGNGEYGALSVWMQNFVAPEMLFKVGPGVFRPRPKVDSAVVMLRPRCSEFSGDERRFLARTLKTCFQQRRKQLGKILSVHRSDDLEKIINSFGLTLTARPEELTPEMFRKLANFLGSRIAA